ncbi:MAG: hypothetical protein AAFY71_14515 [Bacteroidota bacterium]
MRRHFPHQQLNQLVYFFLLAACLFFSPFDIFYVGIYWTTYSIYLPCAAIFLFGLQAWRTHNKGNLFVTSVIMLIVDICLMAYGVYLTIQGDLLWGTVTLAFTLPTIYLTWAAFKAAQT